MQGKDYSVENAQLRIQVAAQEETIKDLYESELVHWRTYRAKHKFDWVFPMIIGAGIVSLFILVADLIHGGWL